MEQFSDGLAGGLAGGLAVGHGGTIFELAASGECGY